MTGVMSTPSVMLSYTFSLFNRGAPGRIRTCDTRFRKPMLYPLSYEGLLYAFAQHAGECRSVGAGAGCLAPDGLCRTCAACRGAACFYRFDTRR